MEQEFDKVFNEYGGYFNPNNQSSSSFLKGAIESCNGLILKLQKSNSKLPNAYVAFINNSKLGAAVGKHNNHYYIGINNGTFELLQDLFLRMLSNKSILVELGDILKEREDTKIFNPQITDTNILFLAKDPLENIIPNDPDRLYVAQILTLIAIQSICMHEYAHIIFGHLDYYINYSNKKNWSEIPYIDSTLKKLDPLISQTLEMDADCFSISILAQLALDYKPPFNDFKSRLKLSIFALYSSFRLFGHSIPNIEDIKQKTHPSSGMRQHIMFSTLYSVMEKHKQTDFLSEVAKFCMEIGKEVEEAFQIISITELDSQAFLFAYKKECLDHIIFLMKYWNNLRPKLEPLSYGNLAPLH